MADIVRITVEIETERGAITRTFEGRYAWTLARLIEAGARGVTPIERPAPRWSHYVMILRREGLNIETLDIPNSGPFKGTHGRYVLRTPCRIIETKAAA
ncbi:MAG: hypothetical protein IOC63_20270 [Methylobacterium sp.]|jgi:hypothetical protein|nr:hypothetical protein [Methylobacterium sp.]MCA3602608.1 hypothetical protein [Methylobacterium sp.]MCA3613439.1 hypothetical protein [Methylobacterium sp.]MCA3613674.1 hypothetical protein [Methylobacterium sp.]MCA3625005.1 hypothetical protein [Methylobacterium sp.]